MSTPKICPNCGIRIDSNFDSDDMLFCEGCGTDLRKETVSSSKTENDLDEQKALERTVEELKDLKGKRDIYSCIMCICISLGSALTYIKGGWIPAVICLIILFPTIIYWMRAISRIKTLRKTGLEQLRFVDKIQTPEISEINKVKKQIIGTCEICELSIDSFQKIFECLKCNFRAHKEHFTIWFQEHNTCPNCKN